MQTFEEWWMSVSTEGPQAETLDNFNLADQAMIVGWAKLAWHARDVEIATLRAALMDLVKEWNAKAEGPVPTDRAIAYAICAEKLLNALGPERGKM
jgi:hypothetical protein